MKSKLLSILLVGIVALSIITASTTVVVGSGPSDFGASKDTYIAEHNPTGNYGTDSLMFLSDTATLTRRGLISFATSTIPVGDAINSAYLALYIDSVYETDPAGKNIRAYILTRPQWHETQASWNSWKTGDNWTVAGGDYDSTPYSVATVPSSPAGQTMYWDMTYLLRQVRLAYPGEDLHLLLRFEDEGLWADNSRITFRTKEWPVAGTRPNLHVEHSWMADPTLTLAMLEMGFTDGLFRVHYTMGYEWTVHVSVWHSEAGTGVWHQTGPVTRHSDGYVDFNVTIPPLEPNTLYEVYAMIEWGSGGDFAVTHPPIVVSTLKPPEMWVYVHTLYWDEATIRMFYIRHDAAEIDLWLAYREVGDPFWQYAAPLIGVTDMSGTHYFWVPILLPDTTYEFRGEADYEIEPGVWDTVLTAVDTFTTPVDPTVPIITIYEPWFSIVWDMQPEFSAYVWLGIHPTVDVWFEYRRTDPVGPWIRVPLPPMNVIIQESYPSHIVEDPPFLLYGEDYEVRGVLDYGAGVLYSNVRAFTMPGIPPSVEILPATDITDTSATIRAMLDVGHSSYVYIWFAYREVGGSWSDWLLGERLTESVPVSLEITDLTRNTEYEYQALISYFDEGFRFIYSDTETFTTLQTTQGWFEGWLDMIRMNDEAGRIMFALFFILLIPAGLYFMLGGLLIPLIAATASLSFFSAIGFIPLWLIILLILIILTGFFRLVKGGTYGG